MVFILWPSKFKIVVLLFLQKLFASKANFYLAIL